MGRHCSMENEDASYSHQSFTLLDILFPKEKLAVEIRHVNCVEIKQCNFPKPSQYDIFH